MVSDLGIFTGFNFNNWSVNQIREAAGDFGRAHTGGDLVVYLPEEKILCISETYLNLIFPAMRSAHPSEWVAMIERAQAMDVDIYVPGHGFVESPAILEEELETYRLAMERVIAELSLDGASVLSARAEEAGRLPEHRAAYALVLARAVAPLRVLAELALPFLAEGGVLAAPKGSAAPREVREAQAALAELGGAVEETVRLTTPSQERALTLLIVRKTGETPERYPRRPGIPRKRPL